VQFICKTEEQDRTGWSGYYLSGDDYCALQMYFRGIEDIDNFYLTNIRDILQIKG
jgi:hypothetical protein